jgi:hypothetical protein
MLIHYYQKINQIFIVKNDIPHINLLHQSIYPCILLTHKQIDISKPQKPIIYVMLEIFMYHIPFSYINHLLVNYSINYIPCILYVTIHMRTIYLFSPITYKISLITSMLLETTT